MPTFSVTFDIVTPESAEHGDFDESGFIEEALTLRDAVQEVFSTRTSACDGVSSIEADSAPIRGRVRWVTVCNGMEFETGAQESRALHIPESVSEASSRRIARLLG